MHKFYACSILSNNKKKQWTLGTQESTPLGSKPSLGPFDLITLSPCPPGSLQGPYRSIFYTNLSTKEQDRVVNNSGLEKIYTLTDGLTDIQKSDLYSEVALAKNSDLQAGI